MSQLVILSDRSALRPGACGLGCLGAWGLLSAPRVGWNGAQRAANARSRGDVWTARCRTVADLIRFRPCWSVPSRTVCAPMRPKSCLPAPSPVLQWKAPRSKASTIRCGKLCAGAARPDFCYVLVAMLIGRAGWAFGWGFGNVKERLLHDCVGFASRIMVNLSCTEDVLGEGRD